MDRLRITKRANKGEQGLTLLEVLVAVFVIAIVALPLLNMLVSTTRMITRADKIDKATYTAQAVIEDLYPLGYSALFAVMPTQGNRDTRTITPASGSGAVTRIVAIDRIPYGSFGNLVSGTACYAHLILSAGKVVFVGPDGIFKSFDPSPSTITMPTSTSIKVGSSAPWSFTQPAGTKLILIIHAGSAAQTLTVTLPSSGAVTYVLYALSMDDAVKQSITVSNGTAASKEYRKFNTKTDSAKDPLLDSLLVNVICKVYDDAGAVESMMQSTLTVKLP